jgi:hypothetical protein
MQAFSKLSDEEKAAVRQKQQQAKARKQLAKQEATLAKLAKDGHTMTEGKDVFPSSITSDEYFNACSCGQFYDPSLVATEDNVELVLKLDADGVVVGTARSGKEVTLSDFNYFTFAGTDKQIWDPVIYAKLAHEGFFTITTRRNRQRSGSAPKDCENREPLPELQPFYGVLDWENFNSAKHVKKVLRKLKHECSSGGTTVFPYHLYNNRDQEKLYKVSAEHSYHLSCCRSTEENLQALDQYQKQQHGSNWLSQKYFDTMKQAR